MLAKMLTLAGQGNVIIETTFMNTTNYKVLQEPLNQL